MKIVFLGTGTSVGVPMIGCDCPVCTSSDPRNRRCRSSLYVAVAGMHVVVDTPPDFREQMLRYRIPRIDAVLFTHSHADHIFGFDDIRRYNTLQRAAIPAYASAATVADLKRVFNYVNTEEVPGVHRPRVEFIAVDEPFDAGAIRVTPVTVEHGAAPTFGYRLDAGGRSLGYVPDCARLPDESVAQLAGTDVMILDALRFTPHSTHLTVAQSLAYLARIGARRSFLIHVTHDVEHARTQDFLPPGVDLSYDGLTLDW